MPIEDDDFYCIVWQSQMGLACKLGTLMPTNDPRARQAGTMHWCCKCETAHLWDAKDPCDGPTFKLKKCRDGTICKDCCEEGECARVPASKSIITDTAFPLRTWKDMDDGISEYNRLLHFTRTMERDYHEAADLSHKYRNDFERLRRALQLILERYDDNDLKLTVDAIQSARMAME